MGLKYRIFVTASVRSDKLAEGLAEAGMVDETRKMQALREFESKRRAELMRISERQLPIEEKVQKGRELMQAKLDEEIEEFRKRKYAAEFSINWLAYDERYLIGSYTHSALDFGNQALSLLVGLLLKAGVGEVVHMSYHHGGGGGEVVFIKNTGDPENPIVESYESEEGDFESFAKRMGSKLGYPLHDIHRALGNSRIEVEWEKLMTLFSRGE